ncbi:hypothetical protein GOODEAATRI_004253 [Goodea atripinnis]|uniref:Uncharacterized protein n=1 Tax=Goodea atripinnis TaxID=208336 RepID=A0ABV0NHH6_9TELE
MMTVSVVLKCCFVAKDESSPAGTDSSLLGLLAAKLEDKRNCNLSQSVIQSFSTTYSIVGHGGAGAYLQQSMGKRRGTPWTGRQSIAGQHTNNHAHTHSYT